MDFARTETPLHDGRNKSGEGRHVVTDGPRVVAERRRGGGGQSLGARGVLRNTLLALVPGSNRNYKNAGSSRDTASRGPTTIVAPESQFRTCPSDHGAKRSFCTGVLKNGFSNHIIQFRKLSRSVRSDRRSELR
ncbi:receptor-like serine/threonine-protein kinase [Dorcoceras hygrometricum]|uniref:Receptor-like serine/threonine-protein kinase n=1 Tax=Dorcoceras hygrometricum TaxID=472368 RepID=A0A2Z7AZF9_9LAMI|nr:receptor-like serine/threonine-protein kinase [Dorcoceras hygrometricum]